MKKFTTYITFSFILICNLVSQPIAPQFDYITSENGLSSNYVVCLIQDSKGFIWIGTHNGLNKYDGYHSEVYKYDENNDASISNNWISALLEDSKGNIWIGTDGGGLNLYLEETGTFKRFTHNPEDSTSISSNVILTIFEDSKGKVWLGTRGGGFASLREDGESFLNYKPEQNCTNCLKGNSIVSFAEDENGNFWLGTEINGVSHFNPSTKKFTILKIKNNQPVPFSNFTQNLYYEDRKNLWIATDNGLVLYNPQEQTAKQWQYNSDDPNSISSNHIHFIYADTDKNIWLGTNGGGLNFFDREKEKFIHFNKNESNLSSLNSNSVSEIIIDRSKNLMLATLSGGINKFDFKRLMFKHYGYDPNNKNSLCNNEVRALYQDKDEVIWIGTNMGLSRFDNKTQTFKNYVNDFTYKEDGSAPRIRHIFRSQDNTLWITTYSGGLYKYNPNNDQFYLDEFYYSLEITKDIIDLKYIYEQELGILWIGTTDGGILRYDTRQKKIKRYLHEDNALKISENLVNCIAPKNENELWLGTDAGLVLFNTKDYSIKNWSNIQKDTNSIVGDKIRSLYTDENNKLWIGTRTGLSIFDTATEQFKQYGIKDGLPSEVIFGILPGVDGNIWLTTPNGLCRVNPITMEFKNINIPQNNSLDLGGSCVGLNGNLIVGGTAGFTIFHPNDITLNQFKPNIEFTGISIENPEVKLDKHISMLDSLILPYNHNSVTFTFAALDFTKPSNNLYKYYLEGFNKGWINYGNKHEVTFTNLDPGEYKLHIKGSNNDGIWCDEAKTLYISVKPPWWETLLFKLIVLLLFFGAIYSIYKYRIKQYKIQKKKLEKTVAEKTKDLLRAKESAEVANKAKTVFLSKMSHELRTPLSAVMGYSQMLTREKNFSQKQKMNLSTIYSSGEHLLSLISDLLDFDKIEAGKIELHKANFKFTNFFNTTISIAKIKADEKGLNFKHESLSQIPEYVFGDERRLKQIMLNLLNNAVKYTARGTISITFGYISSNSNMFRISVKDTGEGISKDNIKNIFKAFTQVSEHRNYIEGTGLGLPITQQLIELMDGKLSVESELGVGSTFIVDLPLLEGKGTITKNEELIDIIGYLGEQKSILVTEDNPTIALMLADLLEPLGFSVDLVSNGIEALDQFTKKIPDLLILDFVMPKMDGLELIKKIRESSKLKDLKVIGISASFMGDGIRDEFVDLCNVFIEKPIKQELFLELIKKQLNIIWKKNEVNLTEQKHNNNTKHDALVFPEQEHINSIKAYISKGDFYNVENIIVEFEEAKKHELFCVQMRKHLERFDDAAIIQFLNKNGK